MNKIELLQKIGNEVCEGCGPDADCGEDPKKCFRILNALDWINELVDHDHDFQVESVSGDISCTTCGRMASKNNGIPRTLTKCDVCERLSKDKDIGSKCGFCDGGIMQESGTRSRQ